MTVLLTAIIYLAFISLGLPDSLLGSAWPVMHSDLDASVSWAGVITLIISVCTIASALLTNKLVAKIGTPLVVAFSVLLTAGAMLAFSFARAFWHLCLFAVPYGFGAGAIDTALNNYVAKHLAAKHMNWLHCCWGVGAVVGPYVMGYFLTKQSSWHGGYLIIALIQFALTLIMFLSLPFWKKGANAGLPGSGKEITLPLCRVFRVRGVLFVLFAGLFYFAIEQLPIVWASTYFSDVYALDVDTAAFLASLFYIGIAVSRAACGFFSAKAGDKRMIRGGAIVVIFAAILIAVPFSSFIPAAVGFVAIGLGCGPIFPSMLHATPSNFGEKYSGSVIGVQMAFAYCGMTFTPILFGKLAEATTIRILPFGVILLAALVLILTEILNRMLVKHPANISFTEE